MYVNLLTIAFVILKLIGTITWSWFWVLSPTIFGLILWVVFFALGLMLTGGTSRPYRD